MKALYRKYRPTKLSDVVGQSQVTDVLERAINDGKISHAYLFIGPRGTGKTSVARIFAHAVNNFNYTLEDDYIDIIEIDGASNRGIDNIRELREKVMIAPSQGKYKIYIIDEVHMLTKEAFNALLKTLEEPPAHVIFIMATTDAYKVPVTITSRAQVYTFHLADPATMQAHLRAICEKEGIKIEDAALDIIVRRGGGSYRDSLSLLDQISTLASGEITKEMVISAMGLPEDEKITNLLNSYAEGSASEITDNLKILLSSGIKPETIAAELINSIIASPRPEYIPLLTRLTDIKEPYAEAKLLVALYPAHTTSSPAPARASQPAPATINPARPRPLAPPPRPTPAISPQPETPKTPEASETPVASPAPTGPFSWDTFLANVRAENEVIYQQLIHSEHEEISGTLHIYPKTKISKTILNKPGNIRILMSAAAGVKITLHDPGEKPKSAASDEKIDKISAIMGGKVEVVNEGENPF
ncbi:DNA polymerase III subunit gamma/tau [Candidatus Saccharibacteria bacterium]|nr:DNA polymerase III subunit gamma/tau [Candidatus Saccharibacteria bacterium]